MSKSRDDRYQSAQALADDLGRFLAGEPALARRPGLVDRATKWARRHQAIVAMAAASVLVLSIVSSVGMVMLAREQVAHRGCLRRIGRESPSGQRELRSRRREFPKGPRHARSARRADGRPAGRNAGHASPCGGNCWPTRCGFYRQFIKQAADDPEAAARAGAGPLQVGRDRGQARQHGAGGRPNTPAPNRCSKISSPNDADNDKFAFAARAHAQQSRHPRRRAPRHGRSPQLATSRRSTCSGGSSPSIPTNPTTPPNWPRASRTSGMLLDAEGDADAAEVASTKRSRLLRPLVAAVDADPRYARNLSIAANNLSYVLAKRDPAAAERTMREAVEIARAAVAATPDGERYQDDLALCYNNLAALLSRTGRAADAIGWHQRAVALQEQMVRAVAVGGPASQRPGDQPQQPGRRLLPRRPGRRGRRAVRPGPRPVCHARQRLSERTGLRECPGRPA